MISPGGAEEKATTEQKGLFVDVMTAAVVPLPERLYIPASGHVTFTYITGTWKLGIFHL